MSTGYQKQIDDANVAARPQAQFLEGDLVKLTSGQRGRVTRGAAWRTGAWGYQVQLVMTKGAFGRTKGTEPRWAMHSVSLKESKILRKLLPAEMSGLPSVQDGGR